MKPEALFLLFSFFILSAYTNAPNEHTHCSGQASSLKTINQTSTNANTHNLNVNGRQVSDSGNAIAIDNGSNTLNGSLVNNSRPSADGGGISVWGVIFLIPALVGSIDSDLKGEKIDEVTEVNSRPNPNTYNVQPDPALVSELQAVNPLSYSITYLGNGNTGGEAPNGGIFTVPTTISTPGTLVRANHCFIGWNTNANGTGTTYNQGSTITSGTNLILHAQWEFAPEYIWHGAQDSIWNNAGNWSSSVIPNNGANIRFSPDAQNNLHLNDNLNISTLNFNGSDKKLILNAFNLTVSGEISGVSNSNYIQTNGTGALIYNIDEAASFTFPIGNAFFNPLTLTNNNANGDVFSARVIDTVFVYGISGQHLIAPQVKVTWEINKTNPNSASGVDFLLSWHEEQEFYGITNFELKHYNDENWELAAGSLINISSAAIKTMSHNNYTGTFSPFAIIDSNSPLPVTLTSFNANCTDDKVNVTWTTASEFNASHYSLQTSRDGQTWTEVAQIEAAGTTNQESSYFYQDFKFGGISYYRLVQVDLDGTQEVYGPISSNCTLDENNMTVYPNPTDADFTVLIQTMETFENATIELVDLSGRSIEVKEMNILPGSTTVKFDTKNINPGTYIVRIKGENDKFTPLRVIIL